VVDVGEAKTADRDAIKAAMSNSSKYSSVEGKAKKIGAHRVKITTDSKLTVDLTRPFATFLGVSSQRLSDLLSGGTASADCSCGGIPEMKQVTWPSREDVISTTGVVIATVAFFGFFLAVVDWLVQHGVTQLFKAFGV
jgi:preprotein translocase subunit SecE